MSMLDTESSRALFLHVQCTNCSQYCRHKHTMNLTWTIGSQNWQCCCLPRQAVRSLFGNLPLSMHLPARRQEAREIGSINRQEKKLKLKPGTILFVILFIWAIVCVWFYRQLLKTSGKEEVQHPINNLADATEDSGGSSSSGNSSPEYYLVFSTGCSASQNWQSFLFFYHAHKVRQPGHIVRIASGCTVDQQQKLVKFHVEVISNLSPHYGVHFTPDFSKISGDKYYYFNKPFGVQHWLEHGLRYNSTIEDAIIIMLLDADMILLRPLTHDFTDESNMIIRQSKRGPPSMRRVMHGQPWAAPFAFGDGPFRLDLPYIFANHTDSPAFRTTKDEQNNNYQGGPPYMATGKDMVAIVNTWCVLVTRVHTVYNQLLGEMFGWSLAAAHLSLRHTLVQSFTISNVFTPDGIEGWQLIDDLEDDELCGSSTLSLGDRLPYIIHYCQHYVLGDWFVSKYGVENKFFSCEKPLSVEPPHDITPGGEPRMLKKKEFGPNSVKREQFMICQMIAMFNEPATWLKDQICDNGAANYEKTSRMFRWSSV